MEIITDPAFLSILMRSEGGTAGAVPSAEDGESAGPSMIVSFATRGFLERADALMAQEGAAAGTGGGSINLEGRKEPNNEAPRTPDAPPHPKACGCFTRFKRERPWERRLRAGAHAWSE